MGLRAFRRQDSGKFFGREREAYEVCDLWRSNQLTVLYGPSGAGKTSLLNAGILPLLDPSQNDVLPLGRLSYSSVFPSAALPEHNPHVFALLSSWSPEDSPTRLAGLTLSQFFRNRPSRQDPYGDPVLRLAAIDQAEDLFLGSGRHAPYREWFIDQLVEVLRRDLDLRVLISIRDDQVNMILRNERLNDMSKGRFALGPLESAAAHRAIVGPLTGTGYSYADEAAQRLLQDLSGVRDDAPESKVIEPVQLQVVCARLWYSLPPDVTHITVEHIIEYANVRRSLESFVDGMIAEAARDHLDGDAVGLRAWLRSNFVADSTRTSVQRGDTHTAGMPNEVIAALIDRHILTPREGLAEGAVPQYELSQESLIHLIREDDGAPGVTLSERTPEEHLHSAQHALREGGFARARREGEKALALSVSSRLRAEIESFLGNVAFADARYDAAIDHYRRASALFELDGQTEAVGRLLAAVGRSHRARGESRLAIPELASAVQRAPDDAGIRTELAWALWYCGHSQAALDVLNNVLHHDGNSLPALRARAEILLDLGRPEEALSDFGRLQPIREPWVRAAYAHALALVGEPGKARREIAALDAATDGHGPALLHTALVEEQASNLHVAAELARRALGAQAPPLPPHLARTAERIIRGSSGS
ncbi:hypothetical protein GCM10009555_085300 [Acrocarpospora macrocephala]|uniref:Novel STAND NTPase 1 domain-containing protein n=1 Tax=Acrocarpospora macrocephala TaxID=150177 RepID=A0A5M3X6W3_9ACTN|nr:hypothetical protein Amac_075050 [Acrocarpospora macrocephala]